VSGPVCVGVRVRVCVCKSVSECTLMQGVAVAGLQSCMHLHTHTSTLSLCCMHTQVALTSLEFWQDTYVATLQGLPSDARQSALATHTGLLQHLTTSLVVRAHLGPGVANSATADARDLPEDVRMVSGCGGREYVVLRCDSVLARLGLGLCLTHT